VRCKEGSASARHGEALKCRTRCRPEDERANRATAVMKMSEPPPTDEPGQQPQSPANHRDVGPADRTRTRSPAALEPAVPAAGASPSRGPCWPPRAHDPSPRARARSSVAPVCAQPRGLAPPRRKHADVGAAPPTPPARHGRVGVPPRRQALPYRRRRPGMGAWGRRPVATTALARAGADPTQLGAGRWPPLPSHGSSPDGAPDPCAAPSECFWMVVHKG
jgi:hypothetical protein